MPTGTMGRHANGVANDWPDIIDSVAYTIRGMSIFVEYTVRIKGEKLVSATDVRHFRGRHVDTDNSITEHAIVRREN